MYPITIRQAVRGTATLLSMLVPELADAISPELCEHLREWIGRSVDLLLFVSYGALRSRLRRRSEGQAVTPCPRCGRRPDEAAR